ncbi:MAG: metallophosphoesterase [Patescibacteria group bacterium]|nr:metallophosphoesterase [Patescibacteria group bacterium]
MTKIFLSLIYYGSYFIFPFIFLLLWQVKKKKRFSIEILFLLFVSLFFIWMRFLEPNLLLIKNYNFGDNNLKNQLKIVVISDIHIGIYNKQILLERAVTKIKKIKPDLILIPGDFVYFADKNRMEDYFSSLKEINIPKLAVLGNHDYDKEGSEVSQIIKSSLEKNGVLMIDNKIKILEINGQKIEFIGLEDIWVASPDYSILARDDSSDISFIFLLSHNPDSVYELEDVENNKKIDLMISGHTHAGQIRLPILYKKIIPSEYDFDKGFYNINNINLFVTPGIGNVALPFRLFNPPEISVINISY